MVFNSERGREREREREKATLFNSKCTLNVFFFKYCNIKIEFLLGEYIQECSAYLSYYQCLIWVSNVVYGYIRHKKTLNRSIISPMSYMGHQCRIWVHSPYENTVNSSIEICLHCINSACSFKNDFFSPFLQS